MKERKPDLNWPYPSWVERWGIMTEGKFGKEGKKPVEFVDIKLWRKSKITVKRKSRYEYD